VNRKLPAEDLPEDMINCMLSGNNIRTLLRSRDDLNACRNDGFSYRTVKAAGPEATKFMRHIRQATIRCGPRFDPSKEARAVLIYKRGDREGQNNSRQITITHYLYRIYKCRMARVFQEVNSRSAIFIDAEKGLIKKTNGCSEQGIIVNELSQGANRKNKNLKATATDFMNGFG
jgi:hypothetical protein